MRSSATASERSRSNFGRRPPHVLAVLLFAATTSCLPAATEAGAAPDSDQPPLSAGGYAQINRFLASRNYVPLIHAYLPGKGAATPDVRVRFGPTGTWRRLPTPVFAGATKTRAYTGQGRVKISLPWLPADAVPLGFSVVTVDYRQQTIAAAPSTFRLHDPGPADGMWAIVLYHQFTPPAPGAGPAPVPAWNTLTAPGNPEDDTGPGQPPGSPAQVASDLVYDFEAGFGCVHSELPSDDYRFDETAGYEFSVDTGLEFCAQPPIAETEPVEHSGVNIDAKCRFVVADTNETHDARLNIELKRAEGFGGVRFTITENNQPVKNQVVEIRTPDNRLYPQPAASGPQIWIYRAGEILVSRPGGPAKSIVVPAGRILDVTL